MQLQNAHPPEEKEALSELRKALKGNRLAPVLERQPDRYLLRFLNRHFTYPWWIIAMRLIGLAAIGIQLTLFLSGKTSWPINPGFILFLLPDFLLTARSSASPEVVQAIRQRLESASLPTLLDAYQLNPFIFRSDILELLLERLTLATPSELEILTLSQRKSLVQFTLGHVNSIDLLIPEVEEAVIVGFLAMATLKLPGAEQVRLEAVNERHANLRLAIAEYKAAMGETR
ncbi:MAG: hypothetical protein QM758_27460 [Armatimonas sp.]